MNDIPFYLVTGFLGSGKTTLLQRLIDLLPPDRRITVIQNEFGESMVESPELDPSRSGMQMVDINHGSAFCVCLLSDFHRRLGEIVKVHRPEVIIMEATGLADPIAVGQIIARAETHPPLYLAHVYTVVEASGYFQAESLFRRVRHQVEIADTVLINKVDLLEGETEPLRQHLRTCNPHANVLETRHCLIEALPALPVPNVQSSDLADQDRPPGGRPAVGTAVLRQTRSLSRQAMHQFLDHFSDAYRIKGVGVLDDGSGIRVQQSLGQLDIRETELSRNTTELVMLGPSLTQSKVDQVYLSLCD